MRNETYVRPTTEPTKIVAAAILKDGKIWTGKRHSDIIYQKVVKDIKTEPGVMPKVYQKDQGFLADNGMFLTREQAAVVAIKAGQLPEDFSKSLLSEYLW